MPKIPIFVGIDPGTTSAYAILDVDRNLVEIGSSKDMGLSELIGKIVKRGLPVAVGTDKFKQPELIEQFAAKTGCRIIAPSYDLKVDEKKGAAEGYDFKDTHQMDALASALFAYNSCSNILRKIRKYVSETSKEGIFEELIVYVIKEEIPVKEAIRLIEGKDEETIIVRKVIKEKIFGKKDFLRLYGDVGDFKKENNLLMKYNHELKNRVRKLEEDISLSGNKKKKVLDSRKIDILFRFKEQRIKELTSKLEEKERAIKELEEKIAETDLFISKIKDGYLLKKLKNLGLNEFEAKEKLLNISEGDILLVDDPNVYNARVIENLKGRISSVVYTGSLNRKTRDELPFNFIRNEGLALEEFRDFAFVKKEALDKELQKKNILNKIIEDYKKNRE